jgi:hypothetical protein
VPLPCFAFCRPPPPRPPGRQLRRFWGVWNRLNKNVAGTNFDTKAEVGPVKLLSISDFVTATGTVQRSAGRGAKRPSSPQLWNCATQRRPRCKEANLPHSPQRRPQSDVWRHSSRRTHAAVVVVARAWLGFAHPGRSAQRRFLAAVAWINPRFFTSLAQRSWSARSERVGGPGRESYYGATQGPDLCLKQKIPAGYAWQAGRRVGPGGTGFGVSVWL